MLQYLTIPIDDVFTAIGTVYHDYPADTRLKPARPWEKVSSYGLMLYWPKKEAWLGLEVVAQSSPSTPPVTFAGTKEAIEFACKTHGVEAVRVAPPGFLAAAEVRVGSVTNTTNVTLRLAIDTNHESFRSAVRERVTDGKSELVQPVNVRMFDAKSLGANFEQSGTIQLILRPAGAVPAYFGVVAIDLGNTSSDLATVSRRDPVYRTASLKLLDADPTRPTLGESPTAMPSVVRIDRVLTHGDPPPGTRRFPDRPEDDDPRAIEFAAGRPAAAAATADTPGLVLGAKRLVSGTDAGGYRKLVTRHRRGADAPETEEEIELMNRIPAELLACRMLEQFRQAARAWPAELAITYPTTFTPRELAQVTSAVERGWLRMLGQPQVLGRGEPPEDLTLARLVATTQSRLAGGDPDGADPGVVKLKLDEATAAAFFFLYRRVFESPGGLLRFRSLYPDGLNVLLYDCGGGTTDIALVRATAVGPAHLRIGVLGRTGSRGFGGDDMTRAVARLLKAKLVAELAKVRGKPAPGLPPRSPDPAAARGAVEQYLKKCADLDPDDHWVPTKFVRGRSDSATRERQRYARELWQWAEKVKADLGGSSGVAKFGGVQKFRDALAEPILRGLTDAQAKAAEAQLKTVAIHRWEADALIDGPEPTSRGRGAITHSIEKCNRLIRQVLRDGLAAQGKPEEEVHWVVLSGNASRYPLVREKLVELLEVPDVRERLTVDEANLKHAVAKGAAMFLVTTRTPGLQVVIDTDAELSSLLPFDVGYYDAAKRKHILLFRESERYADLTPKRVPVPEPVPGAKPEERRTFFLERRFPGDDEFGRFLAFDFADGIRGELEVTYDPQTHEFGAVDVATGAAGTRTDLTDGDVYVAPPERGDV
jgi:hypothetical protein